jgi:hypothetical protein
MGTGTSNKPKKRNLSKPKERRTSTNLAIAIQEDTNSTDPSSLQARQDMRVCDYIITGAACYALGSGLSPNVKQLGQKIYDLSQGNSCGTFTGQVGAFTYRYRVTGNHCDTTAQRATIEGGIMRHLESRNKQICGTECWDMSHGGTWDGYLAIGKTGVSDDRVYCGPHLSFADCTNGGKKDAPK